MEALTATAAFSSQFATRKSSSYIINYTSASTSYYSSTKTASSLFFPSSSSSRLRGGVTLTRSSARRSVIVAKAPSTNVKTAPRDASGNVAFSGTSTPKGSLPAGRTREGRAITADDEAAEVLTVSLATVFVAATFGLLAILTAMFVSSSLARKMPRYR